MFEVKAAPSSERMLDDLLIDELICQQSHTDLASGPTAADQGSGT